jgi:hypothetical protein
MAKAAGVSPATVQRAWSARGLKPHLVRTFKLSDDRRFDDKLIDVVGVYLNLHFIPTSSSWLNMVERWFRELTEKAVRRRSSRKSAEAGPHSHQSRLMTRHHARYRRVPRGRPGTRPLAG